MNVGAVSLIALLAAILIGFARKSNVGILCIAFAMVISIIYKIPTKNLIAGFSSSLFLQMTGITYLFAIVHSNGTLELFAHKLAGLTGKHNHLVPFIMFILGFVLSAVGPGSIPCLAIVPIIAIPIAVSAGVNPIMTAIIGDFGAMAGRMSPLTPEAAVVRELMVANGLKGDTIPLMVCLAVTCLVLTAVIYIYYKGWKTEKITQQDAAGMASFTGKQKLSLLGLLLLLVGGLFFKWNIGLTGYLIGSVLIVCGCGDEKQCIKAMPWNVIIMVLGVGILMKIVSLSGGIKLVVAFLQSLMNARTASTFMAVAAGVMSLFSSGLGVVFPTLVPIAGNLAGTVGANGVELVAAVVIGGTLASFTPMSTTGALIMAGVAQQKNAEQRFPQNKLFVELIAVSFVALFVLGLMAFVGIYSALI